MEGDMRFSRESFDEVAFPPISQAGVAKLPPEMIEEILSMHLRSFDEDPVYQWARLRQLSRLQCMRIEQRFQEVWLPGMSITLYLQPWHDIDFTFSYVRGGEHDCDVAVFKADQSTVSKELPNPFTPAALGILWQEYSAGTRSATVRLGEGVLYGGLRGAHVLGLVPLYGLEYDPADGVEIGFRWRDTMTELMREALYLRRVTFRMVDKKTRAFEAGSDAQDISSSSDDMSTSSEDSDLSIEVIGEGGENTLGITPRLSLPPPTTLLGTLLIEVYMARYICLAYRRARARGTSPSAEFSERSLALYKRPRREDLVRDGDPVWRGGEEDSDASYSPSPSQSSGDESHTSSGEDELQQAEDEDDLHPDFLREVPHGFYHNPWAHTDRRCCHDFHHDGRCCCHLSYQGFCHSSLPPDIFMISRAELSIVPYLPIFRSRLRVKDKDPEAAAAMLYKMDDLYHEECEWRWGPQSPLADQSTSEIFGRLKAKLRYIY